MAIRVDLAEDAFVIRFRPTNPDRVLAGAQKEFARAGHYGVSCFAAAHDGQESDDSLLRRLVQAAELDGVDLRNNPKVFVCATAAQITALGFEILKDDELDELPEHYCADLGADPTLGDAERFLAAFSPRKVTEVLG